MKTNFGKVLPEYYTIRIKRIKAVLQGKGIQPATERVYLINLLVTIYKKEVSVERKTGSRVHNRKREHHFNVELKR